VVPEVFVQLFVVPATGRATGLLGGAMHIAGFERMDEGDVPENVTGARPDVAVEVPASPGTVGGAGASAHVGAFAAGGTPKAVSVLTQGVGSLVVPSDNEAIQ
jgi:hypothetical protein